MSNLRNGNHVALPHDFSMSFVEKIFLAFNTVGRIKECMIGYSSKTNKYNIVLKEKQNKTNKHNFKEKITIVNCVNAAGWQYCYHYVNS